jgi:serine/threonine protein kinase
MQSEGTYLDHKARKRNMKFDTNVISGMRSPGSFKQFKDLITNMLKIDKSERFSVLQCLEHPFFSGVNPNDKLQPNMITHKSTYQKFNWKLPQYQWTNEEIQFCQNYIKMLNHHIHIRSYFFGIDLYQRIRNEENISLLKTCIYIGFKYFLSYTSPTISDLFDVTEEEIQYIYQMEINIYDSFKFNIYQKTLYDSLFDYNIPNRLYIACEYVFAPIKTISDKNPDFIAKKISQSI